MNFFYLKLKLQVNKNRQGPGKMNIFHNDKKKFQPSISKSHMNSNLKKHRKKRKEFLPRYLVILDFMIEIIIEFQIFCFS